MPTEVPKWSPRMIPQPHGRARLQEPGQLTPLHMAFSWKDFQLSKAFSATVFSCDPSALLGDGHTVAQSLELA